MNTAQTQQNTFIRAVVSPVTAHSFQILQELLVTLLISNSSPPDVVVELRVLHWWLGSTVSGAVFAGFLFEMNKDQDPFV